MKRLLLSESINLEQLSHYFRLLQPGFSRNLQYKTTSAYGKIIAGGGGELKTDLTLLKLSCKIGCFGATVVKVGDVEVEVATGNWDLDKH